MSAKLEQLANTGPPHTRMPLVMSLFRMIVLTTTLVDVKTGKKNVLEKTLIKYAGQAPVDFHEKAHPVYNKLDRRDDSLLAGYTPRP